jgi:hypothetical protein
MITVLSVMLSMVRSIIEGTLTCAGSMLEDWIVVELGESAGRMDSRK